MNYVIGGVVADGCNGVACTYDGVGVVGGVGGGGGGRVGVVGVHGVDGVDGCGDGVGADVDVYVGVGGDRVCDGVVRVLFALVLVLLM